MGEPLIGRVSRQMWVKKQKSYPRKLTKRTQNLLVIFSVIWWIVLAAAASPIQAQPTVSRVEPQSWWLGSTLNPVRLLISGKNLTGARVQAAEAGLPITNPPLIS